MEDALAGGDDWLVGNKFSIADIAMTPYVNRLAMMSMQGMWERGGCRTWKSGSRGSKRCRTERT